MAREEVDEGLMGKRTLCVSDFWQHSWCMGVVCDSCHGLGSGRDGDSW